MTSNAPRTESEDESSDDKTDEIEISRSRENIITYAVDQCPPWYLCIFYAIQVSLPIIAKSVMVALLCADLVCGDTDLRTKMMSATMFLAGLCTFLQTTLGVQLPLFQGPSSLYILPILARAQFAQWTCTDTTGNAQTQYTASFNVSNGNATGDIQDNDWREKVLMISGSLIAASIIHTLFGLLGIIGILCRFIGPLTIVPFLCMGCLRIAESLLPFAELSWGITAFTLGAGLIFSGYISRVAIPVPTWNRRHGCSIKRAMIFRSFSIVLSILAGWFFAFILTIAGTLPDKHEDPKYLARTDSQNDMIQNAPWFNIPYPGQFGMPTFDAGMFFGLMISVISSLVDSVADYTACSQVCRVGRPPAHATNRGLMVEGICSILSGAFGACHATSTQGGVIGMIALTGVASRTVFSLAGILMMGLGVFAKAAAIIVSIPRPVIAGANLLNYSTLLGMTMYTLKDVQMSDTRNIITVGMALIMGKSVSTWVRTNQGSIATGIPLLDQLIYAVTGNGYFLGGLIGAILDNTLPGECSANAGSENLQSPPAHDTVNEIKSIYDPPFIGDKIRALAWTRYVPICPGFSWTNFVKRRRRRQQRRDIPERD